MVQKEPSIGLIYVLVYYSITQLNNVKKNKNRGYSYLSDTEAPIIPTNSKAPEVPTVFWLGSYLSDSKK